MFRASTIASLFSLLLALHIAAAAESPSGVDLLTTQDGSGQLAGWKSFLESPEVAVGEVWRLGADGVLVCKGKPNGYLYTTKNYTNFVLTLEWRTPVGQKPGRGGLLLRTTGPHKIWPKSLEAQLNAGDEGDFWGLAGFQLSGPADRLTSLTHEQFGKLTNVKKTPAAVKAPGEWNLYEIIVDGPTVTLKINGREVNRATGCDVVAGPICLTSEGDAIHFRNVRISEKP